MAHRNTIGKDISPLRAQCIRWAKALFLALAVALAGYFLCQRLKVGPEPETIVEFVLTVLAICFALYQFTDSDELKETIRYVAANASTRYVNMFHTIWKKLKKLLRDPRSG